VARKGLLAFLPLLAALSIVLAGRVFPPSGPFPKPAATGAFHVKAADPTVPVKAGPRTEDRVIGQVRTGSLVYDLNAEQDGWRHVAGLAWEGWMLKSQLDGPTTQASGSQEADLMPA